jgi:hypothetical protein
VESSWTKTRTSFKSPLRVAVWFLLRSRENKANKCRELKRKYKESQRLLAKQHFSDISCTAERGGVQKEQTG